MDFLDWLVPDEPRSCGQSSERIERSVAKIFVQGKEVTGNWNTTKALKAGIGLLPEDRKTQGFMKQFTNYDNIAISSLEKNLTAGFLDQGEKTEKSGIFL